MGDLAAIQNRTRPRTSGWLLARATSATHFGAGQGAGAIDLPVARAADTGLPIGPGSAVRGALRAACLEVMSADANTAFLDLFGPEYSDAVESAGILQIDDMHLLAMPVRSAKGLVAWATSPSLLAWFSDGLAVDGLAQKLPLAPTRAQIQAAQSWAGDALVWSMAQGGPRHLTLWDIDLNVRPDEGALTKWAQALAGLFPFEALGRELFSPRLAVVPDDVMAYLCRFATDVRPRVRRGPDGIVNDKAFWQEESIVRDALWYAPWSLQPERNAKVLRDMCGVKDWLVSPDRTHDKAVWGSAVVPPRVQMGGKSSVHHGRFAVCFV